MLRVLWLATAAAIILIPATSGLCQQQGQQTSTPAAQPPTKQEDSLAAAARRSREQKKEASKPVKVFDNDNIPTHGGISTVGNISAPEAANAPGTTEAATGAAQTGAAKPAGGDEKAWRKRFADLRHKVELDQQELEIMQRELGVLDVQNYSDPMKGMQQSLTRSEINDKTAKIEAKKKQIAADQQAIADAEDELRKSGGDPGWAR
jgi:chromosome segregation ATPase